MRRAWQWIGTIGCVLIFAGAVFAEARPGQVMRLFYETEKGQQVLPQVPDMPQEVGQEVEKTIAMSDGQRVTVKASIPTRNDLMVEITADKLEGVKYFGAVLHADKDEHFCGLLERVVDGGQGESWRPKMKEALDLRGQKVEMFVKPTVALYAPFYLSSGGYAMLAEGSWPGHYDMAASKNNEIVFKHEGPQLVFHIFRGKTPLRILRKYMSVAGKPLLPPRWLFTPWRWRDTHTQRDKFWDGTPYSGYYNAEVVEDVLMMEALDIPCGVYWVDRPWAKGMDGYEDFEWDKERLPHAKEMVQWLKKRGMRTLLWIAPWTLGDMVKEGREKGYFLPTKAHPERGLVDFTNPEEVAWWQSYVKKVIDDGVAGFKLDRSEEIVPDTMDVKTHSGMTAREMHNTYPVMYAKATYEVLKRNRDDFVVMPRAGYTGSWKYAVYWGGDTKSSIWGLRSAIIAVQRAAVMGFAVWGSDTGGYFGGGGFTPQTVCRWLGFSAFCPIMEVGPTRNRGLWDIEQWEPSYNPEVLATWSLYTKLHNQIGDYLYELAQETNRTGEPIVRPMWVQFPDDPEAAEFWDQYTLGNDLLVCPLWLSHARYRTIYLPEGEWIAPWQDGKVIEGPRKFNVDCPLHKTPFYIRKGAKIDIGDPNEIYAEALERAKQKPNMVELLKKAGMK